MAESVEELRTDHRQNLSAFVGMLSVHCLCLPQLQWNDRNREETSEVAWELARIKSAWDWHLLLWSSTRMRELLWTASTGSFSPLGKRGPSVRGQCGQQKAVGCISKRDVMERATVAGKNSFSCERWQVADNSGWVEGMHVQNSTFELSTTSLQATSGAGCKFWWHLS